MSPVVTIGREVIKRGLSAILGASREVISMGLKDPKLLASAATRIGMDASKATLSGVVRAAAANKMTTALVLWEMGAAGAEVLGELAATDPEVKDLVVTLEASVADSVSANPGVSSILQMEDEFKAISVAVGICGGWERFEAMIKALSTDQATRAMFLTVKRMGRSF